MDINSLIEKVQLSSEQIEVAQRNLKAVQDDYTQHGIVNRVRMNMVAFVEA